MSEYFGGELCEPGIMCLQLTFYESDAKPSTPWLVRPDHGQTVVRMICANHCDDRQRPLPNRSQKVYIKDSSTDWEEAD